MSDETKKLKYIDVARGIALLVIIVSHANGMNFYMMASAVQAFFVISGYLYQARRRPYGEQIKKNAKRLLVPYFGYSILLWAFYAVIRRNKDEILHSLFGVAYARYSFFKVSTHEDPVMLMDVANSPLWYLPAYFVAGLLFYLIADRCLASWKTTVLWSVVLIALSMLLNCLPILLPWSLDMIGATTLMMLAGAWLRKSELYEKKDRPLVIAGVVALYSGMLILNGYLNTSIRLYGQFDSFSVPLYLIVSVAGSMQYIWVAKWIQNTKLGDIAAFVGVHSVELLCVHMVVLEVFRIAVEHFVDPGTLPFVVFLLYSIVRIGLAMAVSLFAGYCVKKMKRHA